MADYNFTIYEYPAKHSWNFRILTGQRFGRLRVIGFAGIYRQTAHWHCLCECGNGNTVAIGGLTTGSTKSCGCWKRDITIQTNRRHGESHVITPEYRAFCRARKVCHNPNDPKYKFYGGRGIEFRFDTYEDFLAEVGRRPSPTHSLDRIDVNGHYETGNLRWATPTEQARNKQRQIQLTAFGQTRHLNEWCESIGLRPCNIYTRIKIGWCVECAVSIPKHTGVCPHKS